MEINILMRPSMWVATYQGFAAGRVIQYKVEGRVPGEKILIADFGGPNWRRWRVLKDNNGASSGWGGSFDSAESALTSVLGG